MTEITPSLLEWKLQDKYDRSEGKLFLTGVQALVKLPLLQHQLDQQAGLNTAGFISGYRGSPLGNFDSALWSAKSHLSDHGIIFQPGLNEESAATSVLGSQQANILDVSPRYDGVFSMWYGKGPGVDRAGDALKHGNIFGTSSHGGVLVLAGDDHGGKSSTLAFQSEQALSSFHMPVLNPTGSGDYLKLGLFGWAMSRATGLWTGFKCLTETVESSGTVEFSFADATFKTPADLIDPLYRQPSVQLLPVQEEHAVLQHRVPAARAFGHANAINIPFFEPKKKKLALITVGKAYGDVMQAFSDLRITKEEAEDIGIGLYIVRMSWPLDDDGIRQFATGYEEVLVVEEKAAFVEPQVTQALFNLPEQNRPRLTGKRDLENNPLLPTGGELSPTVVRGAIISRMMAHNLLEARHKEQLDRLEKLEQGLARNPGTIVPRTPAFCSGCPHNRSTKIPDGSIALAGIGCHTMAARMPDRPTARPTQMGGEGTNWIGMAPFVDRPHVFQNLGDGTYFHSGLLAIRAAVAAKANITYKILFNDAVAMTGGQPIDGEQTVAGIARQLAAEGVGKLAVITDNIKQYKDLSSFPKNLNVYDRRDLLKIEKDFQEIPGVTALIYEQTCAAEKRRRRKRGKLPDPQKRYFINTAVCEGCGDCGKASNCVSLYPEPTPLGTKRRIDQSSCNKDYSCVDGFCPSFVTVLGGDIEKAGSRKSANLDVGPSIPAPAANTIEGTYNLLVTGIGGTGVVTIGAIIGMAAHLMAKSCSLLDLTGLSQKNGAVMSHVRLAETNSALNSTRIGIASADAVIGCDLLVAASDDAVKTYKPSTKTVLNTHAVPVAAFQVLRDLDMGMAKALARIEKATTPDRDTTFDATAVAEQLFGNAILSNIILFGAAFQQGLVPLSLEAIEAAIVLNNVAVETNKAAFYTGRRIIADPAYLKSLHLVETTEVDKPNLQTTRHTYEKLLTEYQDTHYAQSYSKFVDTVCARERAVQPDSIDLSHTVARQLGKLMAYKDEYEVARLYSSAHFKADLQKQFTGKTKLRFNLAPPLFAKKDAATGLPLKKEYGGWVLPLFKLLAPLKLLRGTAFDVFGYTSERKQERQLIRDYQAMITNILVSLTPENLASAVEIASLPNDIRGFGHVKLAAIKEYEQKRKAALDAYLLPNKDHSLE
ncbi:indolepyruvate ferredoxin oxidoreductase family protein [Kordiimonas pumila]|uniref:Indolepyruvate ferredoxin oxidoreductase family protein n=1 Tax=Kordiimonas pumila TaxID=2161677 RepID=A0ABV7D4F2_9PROT|nr:indolepyruvate ferredoxin oxidoreductase family protein [Kordiimonas pumila]